MPLTDTAIRGLKATAKTRKVSDSGGLYLEISPAGGRWWRWKYRFAGKEKRLSFGVYPAVSLREARDARDAARKMLLRGIDPSADRKAAKLEKIDRAANDFESVTREWFGKNSPGWVESHSSRILRLFERDIFPYIGKMAISEVGAPVLLSVARRIEPRSLETAHRAISNCGLVFRYAIATARCDRDPSTDLRGALPRVQGKHFAATVEPRRLGEILRAMDGYSGTLTVSSALRLAPLVFVRPGELRHARWSDFDLEKAEWSYLVTKTKTPHIVPLSRQALSILRELEPVTRTGEAAFVFPGARSKKRPMSDNAILVAMRNLEIGKEEMTGHGLRAVARTILDEVLGIRPDFIEHQLAHSVRDPNGRAYNRTAHLVERHKMMQAWADHLDKLKAPAEVIRFPQSA